MATLKSRPGLNSSVPVALGQAMQGLPLGALTTDDPAQPPTTKLPPQRRFRGVHSKRMARARGSMTCEWLIFRDMARPVRAAGLLKKG